MLDKETLNTWKKTIERYGLNSKQTISGSTLMTFINTIEELQKQVDNLTPKPKVKQGFSYEPIPSYGDEMTIEEWIGAVESGEFIDSDGHGNLANDLGMTNLTVYPSYYDEEKNKIVKVLRDHEDDLNIENDFFMSSFTKVIWFNK